MAERDPSDLLADAFRAYLEDAPTQVRPADLARHFATAYPHKRSLFGTWRPIAVARPSEVGHVAWLLLLLAGLLVATLGGMLIAGSHAERESNVVLPPIGEVFTCPPGTDPDVPGPVDQARPPVYRSSPMALDRRAGKLVALAVDMSGTQETWTVETWTFDVCTNTWTKMHPDREPPALVGRLVYDVDSDLTIGVHYEDWRDPYLVGNVWAYDLEANTWAEHGVAPTDGLGFYDPRSGLVVAVADPGRWEYDVEADTWTPIRQTTPPREPSGYSEYVYDASVDRIVEYAGGIESAAGDVVRSETWLFDMRTGSWSQSDAETPVFTIGWWGLFPAIVYDETAERTVVVANDRWHAYDATDDRWELLSGAEAYAEGHAPAVYDPVNRRLIVFGGGTGDLAALDLVTGEWTVLLEPSDG